MKKMLVFIFMSVFMMSTASLVSCNNEELFIEPEAELLEEDPTDVEEEPEDTEETAVDTSSPCDFNLNDVAPNSTIVIDCVLDLGGAVINLPENVTFVYEGGDIINGTLNFSDGGNFDPGFLNPSITIAGTPPAMKDPVFTFMPERWGIVQGPTSSAIALRNKQIFQSVIDNCKDFGLNTMEIDEMDAYFDVQSDNNNPLWTIERSIWLPSNFTLKMSDNTFLRVQPSNAPAYNLIGIYKGENITILGGNLLGDRWEHDYAPVNDVKGRPRNSHEWGCVLKVAGGKNILIDGVHIADGSGDGFGVHGSNIRNVDGSVRDGEIVSNNVVIKNSTINASRRNGMSILDGTNVTVENCKITNTAQGDNPVGVEFSSAGTWPKYGISFEAYRERTATGELREYNKIENVTLNGNTFTGNAAGDVVLYTCSNINIENNFFDSKIGNVAAHNVTIRNNTMKARLNDDGSPYNYALNLQSNISLWDGEFTYNYTISGNTIEGYGNAMILGGNDYKVFDNTLLNNQNAIGFENIINGEFYNNSITSNLQYSIAYFSRGANLKGVTVHDENIYVDYRPINLRSIEADTNTPLLFSNCELISVANNANFIENSNNISITNNVINTDFRVNNSENINISNNRIP